MSVTNLTELFEQTIESKSLRNYINQILQTESYYAFDILQKQLHFINIAYINLFEECFRDVMSCSSDLRFMIQTGVLCDVYVNYIFNE